MTKRRRPLTRDDLLHRYARARCITYGQAHDLHGGDDMEELRALVEAYERFMPPYFGEAFTPQTTSVEGVTR